MYRIWVSVFGAGYCPVAPGTAGSAVAAGVFALAVWLGASPGVLLGLMLGLLALGIVSTLAAGPRAIAQYGPDPGVIVSDELAGQAVTLLWWWGGGMTVKEGLIVAGLGFVLFRIFDIIKPPPVRQLEKVPGAMGVLLDDLMAGVYAMICLQVILAVIGS